ncbi:hypothetical protein PHMEG_0003956 [Phytophthora megakarya]|uniref:Uncharacterized protein n=1 Tax=Phytophthora megakarya TaxID=4795 RepID=A0A225WV47_9STRA|nr:hypothetical protein PHMEG_0003956 [Phytophthora megakarya]
MPATTCLKTVRVEVRMQAVTMGVEWRQKQLYHEVAAHLEREAQRWHGQRRRRDPRYGVGLEAAMGRWDEREAAQGRGPLPAAAALSGKEREGLAGNFGNVVSGRAAAWGTAPTPP